MNEEGAYGLGPYAWMDVHDASRHPRSLSGGRARRPDACEVTCGQFVADSQLAQVITVHPVETVCRKIAPIATDLWLYRPHIVPYPRRPAVGA